MKYRYQWFIAIGLLICEIFFNGLLSFYPAVPNLVISLALVGVFASDLPERWIIIGVVFGLVKDFSLGMILGPTALSALIAMAILLALKIYINSESYIGCFVAAILGSWMFTTIYWLIYYFIGVPYTYIYAMKFFAYQLPLQIILFLIAFKFLRKKRVEIKRDAKYRYYR